MRIGVARYNGATLHFPAAEGRPVELEWAGAHTGIGFSPDGAFVVTTMQENALHGWKLADGKHMRMAGYPAKVKSLSWSVKGEGSFYPPPPLPAFVRGPGLPGITLPRVGWLP